VKSKIEPEIRFSVFTGDWEQHEFRDFTKLSQGLQIAIDKRHLIPGANRMFYITNEFLNPKSDKRYYIEYPSKSVIAGKEDILMTRTGNTGKVVTNVEGAFHNNFFKISYDNNETSKLFLYYLLISFPVQKEISVRAGTSTIPDLNHNDFYKIKVNTPLFKEQIQIGELFEKLDKAIAIHQQELTTLKQTKLGFLQKMFPKEGKTVPEFRFPGFTGDWEQRRVGEIFKVTRGQVLAATQTSEIKSYENPYPVYSSQTKKNGLLGYYKDFLFDTAITWTTDGANAGTVNYREGKFYSTNVNGVLLSDRGFANKSVAEALNMVAWKYVSKVGNPKLMNNVMSEIVISLPSSVDEQNNISDFLSTLDNLITLHQHELDTIKETKKAFLQKMFV
jgi:type I restriction enzyme, S subunit